MRLTLLGTGDAGGIPLYGCACPVCGAARRGERPGRGPCCALLEAGGERILLDAGLPGLADDFPAGTLSRILLTHFHPDHVLGLFRLRWGTGPALKVFAPPDPEGCADLYKHQGLLDFTVPRPFVSLRFGGVSVTPLPLAHSRPTFGYCFEAEGSGGIAYLTDTRGLPPESEDFLVGRRPRLLVLDCTHAPGRGGGNHNDLDGALAVAARIQPRRTVLTHVSHDLELWLACHPGALPPEVEAGADGLVLEP